MLQAFSLGGWKKGWHDLELLEWKDWRPEAVAEQGFRVLFDMISSQQSM